MSVKIFVTGGTIDGVDLANKTPCKASSIPKMLEQARTTAKAEVEVLMLKDSREITEKDRQLILEKCLSCKQEKILITHGSITMAETAKFLGQKIKNKTIVLTGSIIPFRQLDSDALFKIGFALAAAQFLPPGVYVAMNGKTFNWNNVKKNLKTGKFEEL